MSQEDCLKHLAVFVSVTAGVDREGGDEVSQESHRESRWEKPGLPLLPELGG